MARKNPSNPVLNNKSPDTFTELTFSEWCCMKCQNFFYGIVYIKTIPEAPGNQGLQSLGSKGSRCQCWSRSAIGSAALPYRLEARWDLPCPPARVLAPPRDPQGSTLVRNHSGNKRAMCCPLSSPMIWLSPYAQYLVQCSKASLASHQLPLIAPGVEICKGADWISPLDKLNSPHCLRLQPYRSRQHRVLFCQY